MAEQISRDLAMLTDELTAPVVTEMTEEEIGAVAGGLYMAPEIAA